MELVILGLFCIVLLLSILLHFSILIALCIGLALFLSFAAMRGFSPAEMLVMVLTGMKKAKNILITFVLIGMMTALWRAAGTIPTIVSYAANLLEPRIMILMSFLLNALVSFLTGTSFGTGATMGVICASVGAAMNINPAFIGGAVVAGAYWGDRCSPVSTSMLLVSEITGTDSYKNIHTMFKTAAVPTIAACATFLLLGFLTAAKGEVPDLASMFAVEFTIHPAALLPAIAILILALLHVSVKKAMMVSIVVALPICVLLQGHDPEFLIHSMLFGYTAKSPELVRLVSGGGIFSMVRVGAIVCISSAYSGIFEKTGMLNAVQSLISDFAKRTNNFMAVLLTSVVTSMASCNQTLATILTDQLCKELCPDKERFAAWLENTVIVIPPLIPWSIAGTTVLSSGNLPLSGLLFACYLYYLPLWSLFRASRNKF